MGINLIDTAHINVGIDLISQRFSQNICSNISSTSKQELFL